MSICGRFYYYSVFSHPVAVLFHIFFKGLSLATYLFATLLMKESFVFTFVLTLIFAAMDFWTVKNITGRLLVKLRWWHNEIASNNTDVSPLGTHPPRAEGFQFEKLPNAVINKVDSTLFWYFTIIPICIWAVLVIFSILKFNFHWAMLSAVVLFLQAFNGWAFWKCDKFDITQHLHMNH